MKIIKEIKQNKVLNHWKQVENFSDNNFRSDIRDPFPDDLKWHEALIEKHDLEKIFIISSDDWKSDKLCEPNFQLITAINNYRISANDVGKYGNIRRKEFLLKKDLNSIDTKLILVAPNDKGPFTIIEGSRRAIALGSLNKLIDLEIFLGISSKIKDYVWARHSLV